MACAICPWDISTHLHSVSKPPVCHGAWMAIDHISMSPGHELIPVHGMRDMSLGHIDTFAFCIKTPRRSWRLDGDWLYFHIPGTWISCCSWHAWYVPGTYRHIYILYQISVCHGACLPVCHGAWKETDYISMSSGHELVPVHGMRDLSLGYIDTCPPTWISSCSANGW